MRRTILSIVLFLPFMVHAEHLFEMGVHGGIAGLSSQPIYVDKRVGFNGGAQLYYNYLSPYVVGFRTGITLDIHNAGFGKTNYEDHYSTIDVENEQMDIDYTIGHLSERYTTWSVGVPLQLALSKKNILFLAGVKAVFPLSTTWKQKVENAALSVYFPAYNNRVEESYPLAASRDFAMFNNGKITLPKVQWWLAMELSYVLPLHTWSRNSHSYIIESLIMLTDTRDGFPLQRILTPIMEANRKGRKLVTDGSLFDVGIKISYAISPYNPHRRSSHSCNCL